MGVIFFGGGEERGGRQMLLQYFFYLSIIYFLLLSWKGANKEKRGVQEWRKRDWFKPNFSPPPLLTRLLRKLKFLTPRPIRNVISQVTLMDTMYCIYNTRSQFRNCWVPIAYQVTVHNKLSKCPPPKSLPHGHVWSWTAALFRTFIGIKT
jgi:hypothetical protein